MNQEKIGKFICELRKEKNLTQNGLGDKLRVTGKAVSKWERGLGLPDISLLGELCTILGVSATELLNGERCLDNTTRKENLDKTLIDSLEFYEKKTKSKYLLVSGILFGCLVLVVVALSILYFVTNYNQIHVYDLYSSNSYLQAKGKLLFNPSTRTVELNEISYADKLVGTPNEIKVQEARVMFNIGEETILEHRFKVDEADGDNKPVKLNDFLREVHIDNTSHIKRADCELKIMKNDLDNLYLRVEYVDSKGETNVIENKLVANEVFANDKIFY